MSLFKPSRVKKKRRRKDAGFLGEGLPDDASPQRRRLRPEGTRLEFHKIWKELMEIGILPEQKQEQQRAATFVKMVIEAFNEKVLFEYRSRAGEVYPAVVHGQPRGGKRRVVLNLDVFLYVINPDKYQSPEAKVWRAWLAEILTPLNADATLEDPAQLFVQHRMDLPLTPVRKLPAPPTDTGRDDNNENIPPKIRRGEGTQLIF
jgi:hypothetical protein